MRRRLILVPWLLLLVACGTAPAPTSAVPGASPTNESPSPTLSAAAPTSGPTSAPGTATGAITAATATRATAPVGTATRGTGPATPTAPVTPAAGEALIEGAAIALLAYHVDPLDYKQLYRAAYEGAVTALRTSGQDPRGPNPADAFTGAAQADVAAFKAAYLALAGGPGAGADQAALAHAAIRAMVGQVDDCSTYFLDPAAVREAAANRQGPVAYVGIGIYVRSAGPPPVIGVVYPGSPAERAGLRVGDTILAVDGRDVAGLATDQVGPLVRGPEGSTVALTIRRPGEGAPLVLAIARARVTVPVLTARVLDGPNGAKVGYLRLYASPRGAEEEVRRALEDFERQGATGWVLDLRGNDGGLIATFTQIASLFVADGKPAGYRTTRGGREEPYATDGRRTVTPQRPLALLIDEGSGGTSEGLAAAAQDYGRGRLFGRPTGGCFATGREIALADGSALNVTIEKAASPNRHPFNRVGVSPDELVAGDPVGTTDPALVAALAWLAAGAGR